MKIKRMVVTDENGKEYAFEGNGGLFGGRENRKGDPNSWLIQASISTDKEFTLHKEKS